MKKIAPISFCLEVKEITTEAMRMAFENLTVLLGLYLNISFIFLAIKSLSVGDATCINGLNLGEGYTRVSSP